MNSKESKHQSNIRPLRPKMRNRTPILIFEHRIFNKTFSDQNVLIKDKKYKYI